MASILVSYGIPERAEILISDSCAFPESLSLLFLSYSNLVVSVFTYSMLYHNITL